MVSYNWIHHFCLRHIALVQPYITEESSLLPLPPLSEAECDHFDNVPMQNCDILDNLEKFRTCDSKLSRSFPCAGMGGGGIKSNRDLKEACLVLFWLSIPLWVFMLEVDVPSLPSFKFIRSPTKLYSVLLTSSAGAGASVSSPSLPIFFPKSSNTSVLSGICFSFYI